MSPLDRIKGFFAGAKATGGEVNAEDAEAFMTGLIADAETSAAASPKAVEPSADVTALTAQVSALTALVMTQNAQMVNDKAETRLTANRARIRSMVNQMKLIPAAATQWEAMASEKPDAFEAAFGIVEKTAKVDRIIARERLVHSGAGASTTDDLTNPSDKLAALAQAKIAGGMNPAEAFRAAAMENPELSEAAATLTKEGN